MAECLPVFDAFCWFIINVFFLGPGLVVLTGLYRLDFGDLGNESTCCKSVEILRCELFIFLLLCASLPTAIGYNCMFLFTSESINDVNSGLMSFISFLDAGDSLRGKTGCTILTPLSFLRLSSN